MKCSLCYTFLKNKLFSPFTILKSFPKAGLQINEKVWYCLGLQNEYRLARNVKEAKEYLGRELSLASNMQRKTNVGRYQSAALCDMK
jgi:hypothetical protein